MSRTHKPEVLVRGVIHNENGELLLVRHRTRGWWFLPGGHLERNETIRDALRRELLEEASLAIEPTELLAVIEHQYSDAGEDTVELNLVISAKPLGSLGAIESNLEFAWFDQQGCQSIEIRPERMRASLQLVSGAPVVDLLDWSFFPGPAQMTGRSEGRIL